MAVTVSGCPGWCWRSCSSSIFPTGPASVRHVRRDAFWDRPGLVNLPGPLSATFACDQRKRTYGARQALTSSSLIF